MNETNMENKLPKQNKKTWILQISLILLIVVLAITAFLVLKSQTLSSKEVFTNAIQTIYEAEKKEIETLKSGKIGGMLTLSTNLKSQNKEIEQILNILNSMNIAIDLKMDTEKEEMEANLTSTYNQKDLLNAKMNVLNNAAYFDLKSIYDKTIVVPFEENNEVFNEFYSLFNKTEEFNCLLENVKNATNHSLKDEYFTKEKETLILNDKEIKATKHTLLLDNTNIKEINETYQRELHNDDVMNALASISGTSIEEVKNNFEEIIDPTSTETYYVSIYTHGMKNEFIKLEIKTSKDTFTLSKENDTTYTYILNKDNQNISGTITIEKDSWNLNLLLNVEDVSGSIQISFKEYNTINIDPIDSNNTIREDELSENEMMIIMENLQKQEGIMDLIQTFSSFNNLPA